jgi:GT2 family glycosyltransferase
VSANGEQAERARAVSAVVVNHQGLACLFDCLAALLASEPPPAEVIVVDSGSTDGAPKLVRERFPSVRVIELGANLGPAAARNRGLREARHERVLTIDNDVVVRRGTLAALTQALDENPRAAAVQSRSLVAHEPSRIHYDGGGFHYSGVLVLRNFYGALADAAPTPGGSAHVDAIVALCVLQERTRVLAVGGYDEVMSILFEDNDLSFRLRASGEELLVCEREPCLHGSGTAGTSFRQGAYPARRVFLHTRNRRMFLFANLRARTLLLAAPGLVVYELFWFAFALSRGRFGSWCAGTWAFVRALPHVLARRRLLAARRTVGDRDLLQGGPLTLSPQLAATGRKPFGARLLDALLCGWWSLVRGLVR